MNKRIFFIILFISLVPCQSYPQTKIKLLTIREKIINPVTADYIERGLKSAEKDKSPLIILLDTPGGLLKSTEKIVKLILNSSVPVITYVYPKGARAASAGVFIGYASHILAMTPATHIGAAHPVIGGGHWGALDEETQKKIISDTLAWAKNISQARGRPFSFIKDAIEESISITEKKALKKNVCDLIAEDVDELIKKIDGLTARTSQGDMKISTKNYLIDEIHFTQREQILDVLIDPNIAYLLLTLGFLGLIFEVTHPGFGFPGIFGITCLILSFYAFSILPVNYAGLILIILGLIFFITEAFTPTFGMFTLGGVISFTFGSIMLFQQQEFIKVSFKLILPLAISFSALSLFILSKAIQTLRQKPKVGKESLIGQEAIVLLPIELNKKGKVSLRGEIWNAEAKEEINKGQIVVVRNVQGLKLEVERKESEKC